MSTNNFVSMVDQLEFINFLKKHKIIPDTYKFVGMNCTWGIQKKLVFTSNRWFKSNETIVVKFFDFNCEVIGAISGNFDVEWRKFMTQRFGKGYIEAYKIKIQALYEEKRRELNNQLGHLDIEEKVCEIEIMNLRKELSNEQN